MREHWSAKFGRPSWNQSTEKVPLLKMATPNGETTLPTTPGSTAGLHASSSNNSNKSTPLKSESKNENENSSRKRNSSQSQNSYKI